MANWTYESCLANSQQVAWRLADVEADLELDFGNDFMPDKIAAVADCTFLSAKEKRALNQIRGYSYSHLFLFVEEFIIPQIVEQAQGHIHENTDASHALLRFAEEEFKHQRLFELMKGRFEAGFRSPVELLGERVAVAKAVRESGPAAVLLLTSMLEWITQRHYLECFKGANALDTSFVEVFRLHWIEEATHAKLDSLELEQLATELSEQARDDALNTLLDLCGVLDGLLSQQARMDIEAMQRKCGRVLSGQESDDLFASQQAAYRWTFLTCGLDHPIFTRVAETWIPGGRQRVLTKAQTLVGNA